MVVCLCIYDLFCLCSMNGALAFVDTSDCTLMNIAEHYMASDVEWDPTGRYVVTSVSWWSHKVCAAPRKTFFPHLLVGERRSIFNLFLHLFFFCSQVDNAYWLWTFQGRLLQKNNKDRFCQLLWRPRPPTLLSVEQIKVLIVLSLFALQCFSNALFSWHKLVYHNLSSIQSLVFIFKQLTIMSR